MPNLDYLQNRFNLWIKTLYPDLLQHQILKHTTIPEKLDINVDNINDACQETSITDLINMNYDNIFHTSIPAIPKSALLAFVYNACEKATELKHTQAQHFINSIPQTLQQVDFSIGSNLVNIEPNLFYQMHDQLLSQGYNIHYFQPQELSDIEDFQASLRNFITPYLYPEEPKPLVLQTLHSDISFSQQCYDFRNLLQYSMVDLIFMIDLKSLSNTQYTGNLSPGLWIEITQASSATRTMVIVNTTQEFLNEQRASQDPFKQDLFGCLLANSHKVCF